MIGIARVTRRRLSGALLVICIDFAAMPVHAQLAPSQPIKIIVGVPAGGLGDLAARILAQRLSENGHPAIVENRLGGNGIIATDAVAKSRADGYTLIMGNHSTLAILPHITKISYDPEKDLAPIALMLAAPNVAIVKSALPVTSMRELVAYGKINRLTNATQGIGASGHLIGEQFKQLTGVDLIHVHYRGAALALQDVVAGHVDMMFDVVALTREHACPDKCGRWRCCRRSATRCCPMSRPRRKSGSQRSKAGPGSGSWHPPARRARPSIGSTPRPARRSKCPRCVSA